MDKLKVPRTKWAFECRSAKGELKWEEDITNLVTDQGINHLINAYFKGVAYTAAFYVGLLGSGADIVETDTMASHAGWGEFTDYAAGQRAALVLGPTGNKTTDNSANKASFTLNNAGVVSGAFLTTSATKGGTGGTLYSEALFTSGDKVLAADDVLAVTVTVSGA